MGYYGDELFYVLYFCKGIVNYINYLSNNINTKYYLLFYIIKYQ
jgi:hypothetical protein